jgi:hypothetical protein
MNCSVADRKPVREAAASVGACEHVVATSVLDPDESARDQWTLSFVTDSSAGGVPPTVERLLAQRGLTLRTLAPQGDPPHYVATATR